MIVTKKYKYSPEEKFFILYFPLINILFFSTVGIIPSKYDLDIIRGLFSFIVISYFVIKRGLILDKPGKILLIFTAYVSIMSVVTYFSFAHFDKTVFKIITASFFYFFGVTYIRSYKNFILMLESFYYSLIIVLMSTLLASLFNLGPKAYGLDINLGAQGVNTTKILPILFLPLILEINITKFNIRRRNIYYLLIVISVFAILLGLKRGAVLGLSLAFIAYLLLAGKTGKNIKMLIPLSILFLIFSAILWPRVEKAYNARYERYHLVEKERYEDEARYNEMLRTLNALSANKPISSIFGFGFKSEFFVYHVTRMLHTDYMSLLHGTGLLGLLFYLWFYYLIFRKNIKKIPHGHKYYRIIKEMQAINIALLVYLLFIAISGSIHVIELRGFALFFWAGSMRIQYSLLKQNIKQPMPTKSTIAIPS